MMVSRRSVLWGVGGGLVGANSPVSVAAQQGGQIRLSGEALSGTSARIDGGEFVLADIVSPRRWRAYGREAPPNKVDPFTAHAMGELQELLDLGVSNLDFWKRDRWGRTIGRIRTGEGIDVQSRLVARGAVIVRPRSDDWSYIRGLLSLEAEARDAGLGIWAWRDNRVHNANTDTGPLLARNGHYTLVQGRLANQYDGSARRYLNFGEDYKTDVTATIEKKVLRRWRRDRDVEAFEWLETLKNRTIRVRGHVSRINGTSIAVTHPCQIELL